MLPLVWCERELYADRRRELATAADPTTVQFGQKSERRTYFRCNNHSIPLHELYLARIYEAHILPKYEVNPLISCVPDEAKEDEDSTTAATPLPQPPNIIDWSSLPSSLQPLTYMNEARAKRKNNQLQNMIQTVKQLLLLIERMNTATPAPSESAPRPIIVDFCCGSGHVGFPLAYLLPWCDIILLEHNASAIQAANQRLEKLSFEACRPIQNLRIVHSSILDFHERFDIGLGLHACGWLSDMIQLKCFQHQAAFCLAPCCIGKCKAGEGNLVVAPPALTAATPTTPASSAPSSSILTSPALRLSYPRSQLYCSVITSEEYYRITSKADYSDSSWNFENEATKNNSRFKAIIEWDRICASRECGYQSWLLKMEPIHCTPKNDLIFGLPTSRTSHTFISRQPTKEAIKSSSSLTSPESPLADCTISTIAPTTTASFGLTRFGSPEQEPSTFPPSNQLTHQPSSPTPRTPSLATSSPSPPPPTHNRSMSWSDRTAWIDERNEWNRLKDPQTETHPTTTLSPFMFSSPSPRSSTILLDQSVNSEPIKDLTRFGIEPNPGPFDSTPINPLQLNENSTSVVSTRPHITSVVQHLFKDGIRLVYSYLTPKEFVASLRSCHQWLGASTSGPSLNFTFHLSTFLTLGQSQLNESAPYPPPSLIHHFTQLTMGTLMSQFNDGCIDLTITQLVRVFQLFPSLTRLKWRIAPNATDWISSDLDSSLVPPLVPLFSSSWPKYLKHLECDLNHSRPSILFDLRFLHLCHNLLTLHLKYDGLDWKQFHELQNCDQLTDLSLSLSNGKNFLEGAKLDHLPVSLTSLNWNVGGPGATIYFNDFLNAKFHLPHLSRLDLIRISLAQLNNGALKQIHAICPNLSSLNPSSFCLEDFTDITLFINLTQIIIHQWFNDFTQEDIIEDTVISGLSRCPQLTDIQFTQWLPFQSASFNRLGESCPNLTHFCCNWFSRDESPELFSWEVFLSFEKLEQLRLSGPWVSTNSKHKLDQSATSIHQFFSLHQDRFKKLRTIVLHPEHTIQLNTTTNAFEQLKPIPPSQPPPFTLKSNLHGKRGPLSKRITKSHPIQTSSTNDQILPEPPNSSPTLPPATPTALPFTFSFPPPPPSQPSTNDNPFFLGAVSNFHSSPSSNSSAGTSTSPASPFTLSDLLLPMKPTSITHPAPFKIESAADSIGNNQIATEPIIAGFSSSSVTSNHTHTHKNEPLMSSHTMSWSAHEDWINERKEWDRLNDPTPFYLSNLMAATGLIKDLSEIILTYVEPPHYYQPHHYSFRKFDSTSYLVPLPSFARPIGVAYELKLHSKLEYARHFGNKDLIIQFHGEPIEPVGNLQLDHRPLTVPYTSSTAPDISGGAHPQNSSTPSPTTNQITPPQPQSLSWSYRLTDQIGVIEFISDTSDSLRSIPLIFGLLPDEIVVHGDQQEDREATEVALNLVNSHKVARTEESEQQQQQDQHESSGNSDDESTAEHQSQSKSSGGNTGSGAPRERRLKSLSQLVVLKNFYAQHPRVTKDQVRKLIAQTDLTHREVTRWFRNERHKEKKMKTQVSLSASMNPNHQTYQPIRLCHLFPENWSHLVGFKLVHHLPNGLAPFMRFTFFYTTPNKRTRGVDGTSPVNGSIRLSSHPSSSPSSATTTTTVTTSINSNLHTTCFDLPCGHRCLSDCQRREVSPLTYPFTSYCHACREDWKDCSTFPTSLKGDRSYEELRWSYHQATVVGGEVVQQLKDELTSVGEAMLRQRNELISQPRLQHPQLYLESDIPSDEIENTTAIQQLMQVYRDTLHPRTALRTPTVSTTRSTPTTQVFSSNQPSAHPRRKLWSRKTKLPPSSNSDRTINSIEAPPNVDSSQPPPVSSSSTLPYSTIVTESSINTTPATDLTRYGIEPHPGPFPESLPHPMEEMFIYHLPLTFPFLTFSEESLIRRTCKNCYSIKIGSMGSFRRMNYSCSWSHSVCPLFKDDRILTSSLYQHITSVDISGYAINQITLKIIGTICHHLNELHIQMPTIVQSSTAVPWVFPRLLKKVYLKWSFEDEDLIVDPKCYQDPFEGLITCCSTHLLEASFEFRWVVSFDFPLFFNFIESFQQLRSLKFELMVNRNHPTHFNNDQTLTSPSIQLPSLTQLHVLLDVDEIQVIFFDCLNQVDLPHLVDLHLDLSEPSNYSFLDNFPHLTTIELRISRDFVKRLNLSPELRQALLKCSHLTSIKLPRSNFFNVPEPITNFLIAASRTPGFASRLKYFKDEISLVTPELSIAFQQFTNLRLLTFDNHYSDNYIKSLTSTSYQFLHVMKKLEEFHFHAGELVPANIMNEFIQFLSPQLTSLTIGPLTEGELMNELLRSHPNLTYLKLFLSKATGLDWMDILPNPHLLQTLDIQFESESVVLFDSWLKLNRFTRLRSLRLMPEGVGEYEYNAAIEPDERPCLPTIPTQFEMLNYLPQLMYSWEHGTISASGRVYQTEEPNWGCTRGSTDIECNVFRENVTSELNPTPATRTDLECKETVEDLPVTHTNAHLPSSESKSSSSSSSSTTPSILPQLSINSAPIMDLTRYGIEPNPGPVGSSSNPSRRADSTPDSMELFKYHLPLTFPFLTFSEESLIRRTCKNCYSIKIGSMGSFRRMNYRCIANESHLICPHFNAVQLVNLTSPFYQYVTSMDITQQPIDPLALKNISTICSYLEELRLWMPTKNEPFTNVQQWIFPRLLKKIQLQWRCDDDDHTWADHTFYEEQFLGLEASCSSHLLEASFGFFETLSFNLGLLFNCFGALQRLEVLKLQIEVDRNPFPYTNDRLQFSPIQLPSLTKLDLTLDSQGVQAIVFDNLTAMGLPNLVHLSCCLTEPTDDTFLVIFPHVTTIELTILDARGHPSNVSPELEQALLKMTHSTSITLPRSHNLEPEPITHFLIAAASIPSFARGLRYFTDCISLLTPQLSMSLYMFVSLRSLSFQCHPSSQYLKSLSSASYQFLQAMKELEEFCFRIDTTGEVIPDGVMNQFIQYLPSQLKSFTIGPLSEGNLMNELFRSRQSLTKLKLYLFEVSSFDWMDLMPNPHLLQSLDIEFHGEVEELSTDSWMKLAKCVHLESLRLMPNGVNRMDVWVSVPLIPTATEMLMHLPQLTYSAEKLSKRAIGRLYQHQTPGWLQESSSRVNCKLFQRKSEEEVTVENEINQTSTSQSTIISTVTPQGLFKDGLHLVYSYLPTSDWLACMNICRSWYSAGLSQPCRQLTTYYDGVLSPYHRRTSSTDDSKIDPTTPITDSALRDISIPSASSSTSHVNQFAHHFTRLDQRTSNPNFHLILTADEFLELVHNFPNLSSIVNGNINIDAHSIDHCIWPNALTELSLCTHAHPSFNVVTSVVQQLSDTLHSLTLTVHWRLFNLQLLHDLQDFKCLTLLELHPGFDEGVDFIGISNWSHLPDSLTHLNLCDGTRTALMSIHALPPLPNLNRLEMGELGPGDLKRIYQFAPNLKQLIPSLFYPSASDLFDIGLFQSVHTIWFQLPTTDPNDIFHVLEIPPLEHAIVSALSSCVSLTKLVLTDLDLSSDGFIQLSHGLSSLIELDVRFIYHAMEYETILSGLTSSSFLSLERLEIGPEYIRQIKGHLDDRTICPKLSYLLLGSLSEGFTNFEYDTVSHTNTDNYRLLTTTKILPPKDLTREGIEPHPGPVESSSSYASPVSPNYFHLLPMELIGYLGQTYFLDYDAHSFVQTCRLHLTILHQRYRIQREMSLWVTSMETFKKEFRTFAKSTAKAWQEIDPDKYILNVHPSAVALNSTQVDEEGDIHMSEVASATTPKAAPSAAAATPYDTDRYCYLLLLDNPSEQTRLNLLWCDSKLRKPRMLPWQYQPTRFRMGSIIAMQLIGDNRLQFPDESYVQPLPHLNFLPPTLESLKLAQNSTSLSHPRLNDFNWPPKLSSLSFGNLHPDMLTPKARWPDTLRSMEVVFRHDSPDQMVTFPQHVTKLTISQYSRLSTAPLVFPPGLTELSLNDPSIAIIKGLPPLLKKLTLDFDSPPPSEGKAMIKLPPQLESFTCNSHQHVFVLPSSLRSMNVSYAAFTASLKDWKLPTGLEILQFTPWSLDESISTMSDLNLSPCTNLKELRMRFNLPGCIPPTLPSSLESITLLHWDFDSVVNPIVLPVALKSLKLEGDGMGDLGELMPFPSSLEELDIKPDSKPLRVRASHIKPLLALKRLRLGYYNDPLPVLSTSLLFLDLGSEFNQSLVGVTLPPMLSQLYLGRAYNQPLDGVILPRSLYLLCIGNGYGEFVGNDLLTSKFSYFTSLIQLALPSSLSFILVPFNKKSPLSSAYVNWIRDLRDRLGSLPDRYHEPYDVDLIAAYRYGVQCLACEATSQELARDRQDAEERLGGPSRKKMKTSLHDSVTVATTPPTTPPTTTANGSSAAASSTRSSKKRK